MLGRLVSTTPRRVLAGSALVFVLLGVLAAGAIEALSLNRYEAPGSEAIAARAELAQRFGTGSPNVAVLVTARSGTVDDPAVAAAGAAVTERLAAQPGVGDVWSYWSAGAPATLAAEDRRHALVLAWVPGDADRVRGEVLPAIEADVIGPADTRAVSLQLGGGDEVFRVVAQQARADFVRAELIVLPMVGLLLWLVYRRFAPALATLAVGVFSVVTTLGILRIITLFTEVSTFASNIALVMGIGLGVDYGLFVVYRFREELAAGRTVDGAVRAAVAHAGRTVAFSGATVAASLAVLVVFPFPFLSSFAYAGIAVVVTAVFGAVVVLPALLRLLGHRALPCRGVVSRAPENSFWFRTATRVMRRPVLAGGVGLLVLAVLGAPALAIDFGSPDDRLLPSSQPVRAMYDTIRADFATEEADAVQVVAPQAAPSELDDYAAALSRIEGVQRVDSVAGAFAGGLRIGEPGPGGPARFTSPQGGTWLSVLPTGARLAGDPTGLVAEVRALPAPSPVLVGGYPAELADYRDSLIERLPLVGALIVLVTFVVLFLMTGSVVAPVKATVLNLLSLSVMFGVLVWGFQEGGLAGLLGFTPTGVIEPSIPILMFCIAYGLSMDYEVFLLARIKADVDRTGDVLGSVPRGIARSGPLVTAAAVILAASFAVYATSEVTFLQQLGIGMALAVIVDATVIRGVLVPAAMRLAGRANWWAPAPLRRLHDRIGFAEEPTALVHSEEKPSLAPSPLS